MIAVTDPATGAVIGTIPDGSPHDAEAAVASARAAAGQWARTAAGERSAALWRAADELVRRRTEIARLQTRECGKPLADSLGGVDAAIGAINQYAELGPLHRGRSLQGGWGAIDSMVHVPRGVAALLVPWNDPVATAGAQIAANLVVGNTVVLKPSERTPLCTAALVECFAHLPDGVLDLLLGGPATGAALVDAPIDLVVFTGSVATGRTIAVRGAQKLLKVVLELGGKDAMVIDDGVDPRWAAAEAATGAFANAGQLCTSVERIYVHRNIAASFIDELVSAARGLRMGPGLDPTSEMGPLIDGPHRSHVHGQVERAMDRGARLLAGGEVPAGPGWFYPPTVVTGVSEECELMREETFGPVAAVRTVDSFDEGLARAATSNYGLAAVVLTPSMAHAQAAWRSLPVGTVKVNAVFGGAPGGAAEPVGASGNGFGYGPELLDEVTQTRVVHQAPYPRHER